MATKHWVGGAVSIAEEWTITVSGTWAENDTASVTVNNKTLTLTLTDDTRTSTADVASDIAAMINGDDANGDETRSALGSDIGEFATWSASASGSTVVITGDDDGRPMGTLTVSETTAGDGALAISETTTGEGPYTWDTVANWNTASVPGSGDDVVFDYRASNGVKYNLDQTGVTVGNIYVRDTYRYGIGLPAVNTETANLPYGEHLATYLTLDGVGSGDGVVHVDNPIGSSVKIDVSETDATFVITGTGQSVDDSVPACDLKINSGATGTGTGNARVHVLGGSVGLCTADGASGDVDKITLGRGSGANVFIGPGMVAPTVDLSGGTLRSKADHTTLNQSGGTLHQVDGQISTLYLNAGTAKIYSDETIAAINMGNGVLDFSGDSREKTVTKLTMYAKGTVRDPAGVVTFTNGIDVYGLITGINLDFPARRTWTISDIT